MTELAGEGRLEMWATPWAAEAGQGHRGRQVRRWEGPLHPSWELRGDPTQLSKHVGKEAGSWVGLQG